MTTILRSISVGHPHELWTVVREDLTNHRRSVVVDQLDKRLTQLELKEDGLFGMFVMRFETDDIHPAGGSSGS